MKLKVRVNRKQAESMTRQITNQLAGLIERGTLGVGELLPSERTLADSLGVARNVVRRSYDYLTSGGHVESEGRKGRRVSGAKRKGVKITVLSKTSKSSSKKAGTKGGKGKAVAVTVRVRKKKSR